MALPVKSQARLRGAHAKTRGPAAPRFAARLRQWLRGRWRGTVRSRVLPAGLRAQLGLGRAELLLAAGYDAGGGYALIATDRALHHRAAGGWSRLGWEQITDVGWDTGGGRLIVTASGGGAPPRTAVPLRECGTLVEVAAERITHTRLGSWTVMPDGRRRVLAEARRRPLTGEVLWIVSSPDGLDLTDRQVRTQVDGALSRLREELGIPRQNGAGLGL